MSTKVSKYAKLIMVTPENNNKFYEMSYEGGSTFTVKYGRVESTSKTITKSLYEWDKVYNEKINKGYKDMTDLMSVKVEDVKPSKASTLSKIDDAAVEAFLSLMKNYTDNLVSKTYSVKAEKVSQKQVDTAQKMIDELRKLSEAKKVNNQLVNEKLVELYTIIPRYMSKVPDYLLPKIDLLESLDDEQANLDAIASQVALLNPKTAKKAEKKAKEKARTLLDVLEISMKEIKPTKEIDYLMKQIPAGKIKGVYEISKERDNKTFDGWMKDQSDKSTRILIHGTRCTSVIPIIEQGLKIRPVGNFQFSGKAYGDGNYFSETVNKSLGYTGYDNDQVLLVYEVHVGKPYTYDGWYRGNTFTLNYKELKSRGYDSTFVKAGNGLLNSEIIAYNEEQCRLKYVLWLKR